MPRIGGRIARMIICCSCVSVVLASTLSIIQVVSTARIETEGNLAQIAKTYAAEYSSELMMIEDKVNDLYTQVANSVDAEAIAADPTYLPRYSDELAPFFNNYADTKTDSVAAYCYFNPEFSTQPYDIYYVDSNSDGKAERQAHIPLEYYNNTPEPDDDKYWWYGAVESGGLVWTNPYKWTLADDKVIEVVSCARPVIVDGKLIAVVGTYYNVDRMASDISAIKVFETGYTALVNEKLDFVIHPEYRGGNRNNSDNMLTVDGGQLREVADTILTRRDGAVRYKINGQNKLMAFATLSNGWKLLICPPLSEVYAPIYHLLVGLLVVLIFCVLLSMVVARRMGVVLARPILKLVDATRSIAGGDFDVRIDIHECEELDELGKSFNEMAVSISNLNKGLNDIAYTDKLTGMGNRHYFERQAVDLLSTGKHHYAYVLLDINKFKLVNDLFGYEQGDLLLQYIAKVLAESTFEGEVAARFNADSFHLLYIYNNNRDIECRLHAIAEQIAMYSIAVNEGYKLTIGCGVCVVDEESPSVSLVGDKAKLALDKIKGAHTFTVEFYNDNIRDKLLQEQDIENMMEGSLQRGEFKTYLQPKHDPIDGRIVGSEALVRWIHPQRGMIMPDTFIPVFERNGFIAELDFFMLSEVCKLIRAQLDDGVEPMPVSVNQSRQYLNVSNYISTISRALDMYNIPSRLIELEITETAFFEDQSEMINIVQQLHDMGFVVSLDDFGSGYSSFNMLQDILVDILKIDKNFLRQSVNSDRGKKIMANIISMAHELGMLVVAEGVETAEQVQLLRDCSCDIVQGYYYSRPIPQDEMDARWRDQANGK